MGNTIVLCSICGIVCFCSSPVSFPPRLISTTQIAAENYRSLHYYGRYELILPAISPHPFFLFPLALSQPSFWCQQTTLGLHFSALLLPFLIPVKTSVRSRSVASLRLCKDLYFWSLRCAEEQTQSLLASHFGFILNQSNQRGGRSYT